MTLLNVNETANRLRTSARGVRHLIKNDKSFPSYPYGSKSYRIIAEKLDKWILDQVGKTSFLAPSIQPKKVKASVITPQA